jgi:tetratricopeptide (TPR) repeat protein
MFIARSRFHQGRTAEGLRDLDGLVGAAPSPARRAGLLRERALGRVHQGACAAALADLQESAGIARRDRDAAAEAMARMDAAVLHMVARKDRAAASRQVRECEAIEEAITYHDTYFTYWPYWGSRFKLDLLNGDFAAAEALARRKFGADKWYGPYVEAYLHAARGNCAQAVAAASRILEWGPADENIPLLYFLARCQLEHGDAAGAEESVRSMQALHSHLTLGTPYYAAGLKLAGEACEQRGDLEAAARGYSRLLELWRDGDPALPDRLDARRRLDRLKSPLAAAGPQR